MTLTRPYRREILDDNGYALAITIDQDAVRVHANANAYPSASHYLTPGQARELVEALQEALLVHAELYDECTRLTVAPVPLDGCTCGGIGNTGAHFASCLWSAR